MQCALAWYTGAFADRERQLGVEILLDALLGSNQAPLKAALLNEKLGADIDIGFDDSTLQPTLELVLRGATEDTAARFAAGVRKAVDDILAEGIPEDLLLASLNAAEFASLERPGSIPDGVLDAINAATGWLHTGDPAMLLHTNSLFASLREKLAEGWFDALLKDLFAAEPVQVTQVPTLPKKEEEAQAARVDGKLVLEHPLTVADLGSGEKSAAGGEEQLAGATLLHHPSAGSTYLNFYYDLGSLTPEEMQYLDLHLWMTGDILLKADKMSMANSLELRVPFLDKEVMAVAEKIPRKYRVTHKETTDEHTKYITKYAMRLAAKKDTPPQTAKTAAKKKLGFPVPIRVWLREDKYYNIVKDKFTGTAARKFFNCDILMKLLDDHKNGKCDNSRKIWTLFIFLVWYGVYFEGSQFVK